jgi:hypothetical protein
MSEEEIKPKVAPAQVLAAFLDLSSLCRVQQTAKSQDDLTTHRRTTVGSIPVRWLSKVDALSRRVLCVDVVHQFNSNTQGRIRGQYSKS